MGKGVGNGENKGPGVFVGVPMGVYCYIWPRFAGVFPGFAFGGDGKGKRRHQSVARGGKGGVIFVAIVNNGVIDKKRGEISYGVRWGTPGLSALRGSNTVVSRLSCMARLRRAAPAMTHYLQPVEGGGVNAGKEDS